MKPLKLGVIGLCVSMTAVTAVITGPTGTAEAASTPNIDSSFATGGLTPPNAAERGQAAMDSDGRLLWLYAAEPDGDPTLTRLTAAGAMDTTFGGDGSVTVPFEGVLHPNTDGTISVVTIPDDPNLGIRVHRAAANGDPVITKTTLTGVPLTIVRSVSERANGVLLVSAVFQDTLPQQEHVIAINSDGDLDTGWSDDGDLVITDETIYGAAADGDLVVTVTDANRVRRYTAAGDADLEFDVVNLPSHFQPYSVEVHDGAYYVNGMANDVTLHMAVVKVLPAGYLDATFGTEGMATGVEHECSPTARRSFVTDAGVYLIGHNGDCGAGPVYVQRFTPNGFADTSFGTTGEIVVDQVGSRQASDSDGGGVQADGKVVVAFGSTVGNLSVTRLLAQRINPFVSLAATKVLSGKTTGARMSAVVTVQGKGGVPTTGVAAVALNVTVSATKNAGGVIAYPTGGTAPKIYSNAHNAKQSVIQKLVVPLGTNGRVTLVNNSAGAAALTAVIVGYYRTGAYRPVTQSRLVSSTLAAGKFVNVVIAGRGGVPYGGVAGILLNVTVRGAKAGTVKVYPTSGTVPAGTIAARAAGQPGNAGITVAPGSSGRVTFVNNSAAAATITADVVGYTPL